MTDRPGPAPRRRSRSSIGSSRQSWSAAFRPAPSLRRARCATRSATSRSVVRRALLVLAQRGIVDLRSNRGAFIASPSPEMARNVFEARRTIEVAVVSNAIDRLKAAHLAALRSLTQRAAVMRRTENRHEAIRLSGELHIRLAEFAGNPVLLRFVEELVAQTSLIIGLFGSLRLPSCSEEEHEAVIDAIEARDEAAAVDAHGPAPGSHRERAGSRGERRAGGGSRLDPGLGAGEPAGAEAARLKSAASIEGTRGGRTTLYHGMFIRVECISTNMAPIYPKT